MSGRATAEAINQPAHAALVEPDRSLSVVDARPAAHFSLAEHDAALAELSKKAGPATEAIVTRVSQSFESYRAELNASAGGQASDRVMLLAHNAQRAQLAVELQVTVSTAAHGAFVQADNMKREEQVAKGLRNLVGICAFASDLLNKAHEAAVAEGRAKRATVPATQQLFDAIGASAGEVVTHSPSTGGGTSNAGTPYEAFSSPVPGGSK